MALSNTFDKNYPLGTAAPSVIDNAIRQLAAAIQERMNDHNGSTDEGDHYWPFDDTLTTQVLDTDTGEHRKVTLRTLTAAEAAALDASKAVLYRLVTDGEYYVTDGAGNTIQLTNSGISSIGYTITAKTSDYVITAAECKNNICFTNTGAGAVVTFTLPAGVTGMRVSFLVTDTNGIRIDPPSGVSFRQLGTTTTAANYVQSLVAGTFLDLVFDGTYWTVVGAVGGWTDE